MAADDLLRKAWDHHNEMVDREPGTHVSDLIHCLRQTWYKRNGYVDNRDDDGVIKMLLGIGWGEVVQLYKDETRLVFELNDGTLLHGTMDDNLPEYGLYSPGENKLTWYSTKNTLDKELAHYVEQLGAYCVMHGKLGGRINILHMRGDYKGFLAGPKLVVWDVEFTPKELEDFEDELNRRNKAVKSDIPPGQFSALNYEWECKYCGFNRGKGGPCSGFPGRKSGFFESTNVIPEFEGVA